MKTLKLVLGGVVALLTAFGLTITAFFLTALANVMSSNKATGLGAVAGGVSALLNSPLFWLAVFLIFAIGLFLSYRKLYM